MLGVCINGLLYDSIQSTGYGTVLFGVLNKIWKFFGKFKIKFDFNKRGSVCAKNIGIICKQDEMEHRGNTHKIIDINNKTEPCGTLMLMSASELLCSSIFTFIAFCWKDKI